MPTRADRPARPVLTLYGRTYCHLCDEMIAALRVLQREHPFDLDIMDVDSDPALEARYGELVPVLAADGKALCHYYLDAAAVTAYLRQIG